MCFTLAEVGNCVWSLLRRTSPDALGDALRSSLSHSQVEERARMDFRVSLLLLFLAVVMVSGQRRRPVKEEWNYRDGSEKVSMRGVANLTQVLDNWRFDIMNKMRSLLQNDHQTLLPDYSRIQPLSEALDDLYKEFNALKAHLGDLTEKFGPIETFIDELKAEKAAGGTNGGTTGATTGDATGAAGSPPLRRKFIKKKTPAS